ncbi:hypothetical protein G7Y89_g10394 [Cudoniella acicularis]|uniref:Carboxylesterase type B domain-containing protein n=1 Tax=Cudoniella acicularis TaxID=354080 RepID=A0A8H4RGJ2_9HELO|nr:hypothetical protein G7Y89_g10394 [Cudoniella acicularis]
MTCIVTGFPSHIAALQFEWAWQNPHITVHITLEDRIQHATQKKRSGHPKRPRHSVTSLLSNLHVLLRSPSFARWPLELRFFSQDVHRAWLKWTKAASESIRESIPVIEDVPLSESGASGDEKIGSPARKKRKNGHGIAALPIDYAAQKPYVEKAKEIVDFEREGKCEICHTELEHEHDAGLYTICPNTGCESVTHLTCLAKHFLKGDENAMVPIKGECPNCKVELLWVDIVKELTLRIRGQKEVQRLLKVKRTRKTKAGTSSQPVIDSSETEEDSDVEILDPDIDEQERVLEDIVTNKGTTNTRDMWDNIDETEVSDTESIISAASQPKKPVSHKSKVGRLNTSPIVTVKNGSYSGIHNPTYNQDLFLGIPYAQPPVNDLRFRVPVSLNTSWERAMPATAYSPFCVGYGGDDTGHELSEDCLYLSVVRPSTANGESELPVAVWIHGGGLFMGGSNDARYNLSFIVQNSVEMGKSMIGVSIQYRLSAWGFLGGKEALEGGATNLGFRDQRLALHWIRENIGAFGGSPDKVTIWGESAGAQSVGSQLLAYNGRDDSLFRGAIAESGGPAVQFFPTGLVGGYNSSGYQTIYNTLVSNTSCASTLKSETSLSCLRSLPFAELNAALNISTDGLSPFVPVIDGDFITTHPSIQLEKGDFVKVPFLIGTNTDEGTAFAPSTAISTDSDFLSLLNTTGISPISATASMIAALYPDIPAIGIPNFETYPYDPNSTLAQSLGSQYRRKTAYFGDIVVNAPRRASNHAWSLHSVPSYSYRFNVVVNGIPAYIGATHFQEVVFVFNNTQGQGYATDPFANLTAVESEKFQNLARFMSRSWVSFVTEGNPNANGVEGVPEWPVYDVLGGGGEGNCNNIEHRTSMDPISIITGVASITATCLRTGKALSETMLIGARLTKIQEILYRSPSALMIESDSASGMQITAIFDAAITGSLDIYCRLNEEVCRLKEHACESDEIGWAKNAKIVWKEDSMKELLNYLRGQ